MWIVSNDPLLWSTSLFQVYSRIFIYLSINAGGDFFYNGTGVTDDGCSDVFHRVIQ